jgi:hypothetical protein
LFAALVFFASFWLYFDAWASGNKKIKRDVFKWLGFLLVSASFFVYATVIEQSILGRSIFGNTSGVVAEALALVGFVFIIIGQLAEPLQKKPDIDRLETESLESRAEQAPTDSSKVGIEPASPEPVRSAAKSIPVTSAETDNPPAPKKHRKARRSRKKMPAVLAANPYGVVYALPAAALVISLLYWRRASRGMERHLKPVAWAFLLLSLSEAFATAKLYRNTDNPQLSHLVEPFGAFWIAEHFFLLAGSLVLGRWVWRYLVKRFLSQLYMIFVTLTLAIFLITTVSFTYLLMHNFQNDALDNLGTAANVLNYALDAKKAETRANAEVIAQNPQIEQAVVSKNHAALASATSNFLASKKQSSLIVTTNSGQVLLRAEDPARWGDSLSSDTLVRRALIGDTTSSIVSREGVLAPVVYIETAVPILDSSNNIIGSASVGLVADSAFVDGIKNSTGLDSAVYSGNILSATTFVAPDGKTRQIGVKETNKAVDSTVLNNGQTFKGQLNILNRSFLAVYAPLKDADNTVVGMLFVGEPQTTILKTAGHSIELTFIVAVVLILLAIIPAFYISRYLARELE